jgi:hypothetical protein
LIASTHDGRRKCKIFELENKASKMMITYLLTYLLTFYYLNIY